MCIRDRSLVARLCPTLITPEALDVAMQESGESELGMLHTNYKFVKCCIYNLFSRSPRFRIAEHKFVLDICKLEPRLFTRSLQNVNKLLLGDDELAAALAAEVLANAGKYIFSEVNKEKLPKKSIEKLVELCNSGRPKTSKMAAAALVYALKNRTEGSKMVETMCEKCFSVLRNHLKYENHALLLSNLKVVSIFLRMNGNLLEKYASTLYEIVMNEILPLDLSE